MNLFSFDYPPNDGGIARLCAEVVLGLGARTPGTRVLAQCAPGADVPPASWETRVCGARPRRELEAWWRLRREFRGQALVSGIWYPEGLIALLAGVRPHIVFAHGSELMPPPSRWRRRLWAYLQRRVLSAAELVVANSEYTRRLVLATAPGAKVAAVPLAVDHRRFSPGDRERARARFGAGDQLVLSSVSRIHHYKGHDIVFRALARLPLEVRERFTYLIAGKGPDVAALQVAAERLGVSGQVRWLGYVAEEDLPDLYRASDLFVLCTREVSEQQEVEGFGLVFLEAQACATPVVGTRTGGIPDAVQEGEGGWLIEADDDRALSELLRRLAGSPDDFRAAGVEARQRIEREATWGQYLERLRRELAQAGIVLEATDRV